AKAAPLCAAGSGKHNQKPERVSHAAIRLSIVPLRLIGIVVLLRRWILPLIGIVVLLRRRILPLAGIAVGTRDPRTILIVCAVGAGLRRWGRSIRITWL